MPTGLTTIAVTGANGFIGSRLCAWLRERGDVVMPLVRGTEPAALHDALARADVIAHMAGVTRPREMHEFDQGNRQLTEQVADAVRHAGTAPLILFASTVRAIEDTEYGRTKRAAEDALLSLAADTGAHVAIFRLAQVFGRGARPYYNAITATLLADAAQGRATVLNSPDDAIELVDVADVVRAMIATIDARPAVTGLLTAEPVHRTTVGAVAAIAARFGRGTPPNPASPLEVALFDAFAGYRDEFSSAAPRID